MFARSARALGQSLRAAATTTSTSGYATTTATTAAWRPAAVASVAHESRATAIGAARGHLASRWNSAPRAGSQTIRRAFAAEAAEEAANEPTALTRVLETIATIATVAGVVVAGAVSSNFYAQTTNELDASIKAGTHVPFVLRGTPLEDPVDQGYHALLEFRRWADGQKHVYLDPISDKLLPDHPDAAYIPHTLVLDLDETLILSHFRRSRGWRTFKRPGASDFLKHMAQFYEVVVYSDQLSTYVDPIVERLDPERYVAGRLFREANRFSDGEYLRDLSCLNRDMNVVIYITARPKTTLQPENTLIINPYQLAEDGGVAQDTTLLDLMPFLESIVRLNVRDVREVIASYKKEMETTGRSIPEIFRSRQVAFQRAQREKNAKNKGGFKRDGGRGWGR